MDQKIYVIGHKSPDLDSVAGAISYANFKNKFENTDKYAPAVSGEVNKETEYILNKFKINKPELILDATDKKIIQVDHNEFSQAVNGIEGAKIIEVLDHHKVVFSYSEPIQFKVMPWGAVCSIIAQGYFDNNIQIEASMAGLMLSAILVDTVISKSPTCTEKDTEIMDKLANISNISDWKHFGMEIFKVRSSVSSLSDLEVIKSDFKDFVLKSGKFGIGQVETVEIEEFDKRQDSIIEELEKMREEGAYHSVILFITDILKEGSMFLISSENIDDVEKALGKTIQKNKVYIDGIISRKKQVAPKFSKIFD